MGSEDFLKFSDINLSMYRVLNRSLLALFSDFVMFLHIYSGVIHGGYLSLPIQ